MCTKMSVLQSRHLGTKFYLEKRKKNHWISSILRRNPKASNVFWMKIFFLKWNLIILDSKNTFISFFWLNIFLKFLKIEKKTQTSLLMFEKIFSNFEPFYYKTWKCGFLYWKKFWFKVLFTIQLLESTISKISHF